MKETGETGSGPVDVLATIVAAEADQPKPRMWDSPEWMPNLVGALRSDGRLGDFDGTLQAVGNGASEATLEGLAHWLVARGQEVGAEKAFEDVLRYLEMPRFQAFAVMILAGPHVEETHDLGGGVVLHPSHSLPSRRLRRSAFHQGGFPVPRVRAGISIPCTLLREHQSQTGDHQFTRQDLPYDALQDALLALTMCRPGGCGVQGVATAIVPSDDVPITTSGTSWSVHEYRPPVPAAGLISHEAARARQFHDRLRALDPAKKAKIRIPIRALGIAVAVNEPVIQAANIRTALDAVFLDDGVKVELVYRLGLRAAMLVGFGLEDKRRIRKMVKRAYDVCSTAVHEGALTAKTSQKFRKKLDLLDEMRMLVHDAIDCRVRHPDLEWDRVEFGEAIPSVEKTASRVLEEKREEVAAEVRDSATRAETVERVRRRFGICNMVACRLIHKMDAASAARAQDA